MDTSRETIKFFWSVIDHIRNTAEPEDYLYKVLGLIFLRYLSDSFDETRTKLLANSNGKAKSDISFEYTELGTLYLSGKVHWNFLKQNSEKPDIGSIINEAMEEIQNYKPSWKGYLPNGYADKNVTPVQISKLIKIISHIGSINANRQLWLYLFEHILSMFPRTTEKSAGEFYSPHSIIKLMVRTIAPDNGNIYDPCCGSGNLLIEANKYINEHSTNTTHVNFYGQELSTDTIKQATMYLAMIGMDATIRAGDIFVSDNLPEVKADYILTNPPFNISWPSNELRHDKRWIYGVPSARNANYLWLQHCLFKLSPNGTAAIILPNGSLNSKSQSESYIRRKMIEAGKIACIIALPSNLFYTTIIPVSLWILTNSKIKNHMLFINAIELETQSTKHNHELTSEAVKRISDIYHKWKKDRDYEDIPGLCKSTSIEKIVANSYSLLPSLYVDHIEDAKDTVSFDEKMSFLTSELSKQSARASKLESSDARIHNNLQINKTLNKIVHAVFCEWFVYFRAPLVSKKRKSSELGLIPEDWQVIPLKKFYNLQMGYSFKSKDFKEKGEIGIIKIKNIRENFIDVSATDFVNAQIIESIDKKYKVESNSLLIAMSGSDAGKVGLVPPLNKSEELWLNQRVGMFKEYVQFGNFFLYLLLSTHTYQSILRNSAIGTAQPNISVTAMNEMRIIIPPIQLIEQFGKEMYPKFETILANNEENKKLEINHKNLFS